MLLLFLKSLENNKLYDIGFEMQNHGTHVPQFSYSPVSVPYTNQSGANSSITPAPSVTAPLPPPPPRSPPPALPPPPPPHPITHLSPLERPLQPPSHQQYPLRPVGQREFPFPSPFYHGVQPRPHLPNESGKLGFSHGGHIPPPEPVSAGQSRFIPPPSSSYSYNQPPPLYPSHHHPVVTTSVTYQPGSSIPPPQHPQLPGRSHSLPTQIGFVSNPPPPPPVPLLITGFSSFPPKPHSSLSTVPLSNAHGPLEPPPPPPAFLPPLPPSPPPMPPSLREASYSDSLLNGRTQFEAAEGIQNSIDEVTDQSVITSAVISSCEGHSTSIPSKPSLPLIQPMADIPSPSSDVEMEDDIYHPVEERTNGRLEGANEEMSLREKDGDLLEITGLHASHDLLDCTGLHASHVPELSVMNEDKRTDCQISSEGTPGALSPDSPASVIKTNVNKGSVSPPYATVCLEEVPKISARDGNPVKLLQNYASDSGSEDKKGKSTSEDEIKTDTVILDSGSNLERVSEIRNDVAERIRNSNESKLPLSDGIAQVTDSSKFSCINEGFKPNESEDVLAKKVSVTSKVDEFGRMVRDLTDSDSDEASYYAEQRFKRERKDYRAPLPQSRRRKSRSPRRNRKRSISRSPSPRRRARSPPYSRRIGASRGERARNDGRNNRSECFAFKHGRCYRGSFCRFLHNDNFRGDSNKHYKDRRQQFHDRARDFESSPGSFTSKMDKFKKIAEVETVDDTELREEKVEPPLCVSPDDLSIDEVGKEKQVASLLDKPSPCDGLRPSQDFLLNKNQACEQDEVVNEEGARSHFLQNEGPLLRTQVSDLVLSSMHGTDPLVPQSIESSSTYLISRDQVLAPPTSLPEPENVQPQPPANQCVVASSVNKGNVDGKFLHGSNLQSSSLMGGFQWRRPTVPHPSLTNNNFSPLPPMDIQLNSFSHQMHFQGFSADRYSFYQPPPPDCHPTFPLPRPWNNLQAPLSLPRPRVDNFSLPTQGPIEIGGNGEQQYMHPELNSHRQFLSSSNSLTSVPGQDAAGQAEPCFESVSQIRNFSGEECFVPSSLGMPSSLNDRDDVVASSQSIYRPSFHDNSGSKVPILTHYNPYASTFEQVPANFNFSSTAYQVETGSTQGPDFPSKIQGNEQYDPLFDSIELSSTKAKNFGISRLEDSASSLKGGLFRHSDTEENNKQKDGQHSIINYEDKDSVGETGTDEVDGMENVSQENPMDTGGEIENDQAQSSPRIKKKSSKDSKSMKLFRIAVANFVKETLKPSWRQGIMSKEAFKTIVRKSVDKVSGAMQDRRLPKSEAKINQYVQSSERKLTKVVMGYLDKYVKR